MSTTCLSLLPDYHPQGIDRAKDYPSTVQQFWAKTVDEFGDPTTQVVYNLAKLKC